MEEIIAPTIKESKGAGNSAVFEIEPLLPGFGYTVANSLRRVLLSSLPGSAITEVKFNEATHEFTTLKHVKEDVLEILLNIKGIKVKSHASEPVILKLKCNKSGLVYAKDISPNASVIILNPEQVIATLDKGGCIEAQIKVENGKGFVATEDKAIKPEFGYISIDSVFSPVESVNYHVESTRVGQMTDYDKLLLTIKTDQSITPREALDYSIKYFIEQLTLLQNKPSKKAADDKEPKVDEVAHEESQSPAGYNNKTKIENLEISGRTLNSLLNAGIKTLGGLRRLSELKLSEIKGLGGKGIKEIQKYVIKDETI